MIAAYKTLIGNQYEASLCMLGACVDRCPDAAWNEPVANLKFCQVAFHALFFTDLYLGPSFEAVRQQSFHQQNAFTFGDYEELEDRPQESVYERSFVRDYLAWCRDKACRVVGGEDAESLTGPCGFDWLGLSRAELHVYNIRHIHHHAAQLGLRLRLDGGDGAQWVGSGWRDLGR